MARAILKSKATLDSRDFNTKVAKMGQRVDSFSAGSLAKLGGAIGGAFAVGAVTRFARTQLEAADRTADLVAILGVSAEAFQALEVSALKYGGTVEQVQKGVQLLRRAQGEAVQGNKEYLDSFVRLGVSQSELRDMGTEDLLERVARGFANAENEASALADIQGILGRSGIELAGVLRDVGENGLQAVIDKAKEAGQVLSNEMVAQLAEVNNQLELMEKRLSATATTKTVGALNKVADAYKRIQEEQGKGVSAAMLVRMGGLPMLAVGKLLDFVNKSRKDAKAINDAAGADVATDAAGAVPSTVLSAIIKLQQKGARGVAGITVAAPRPADNLAAIGGFIGGQTSPVLGAMERAAKAAEISADADKAIRELAEKNGVTLEEIRAALEE